MDVRVAIRTGSTFGRALVGENGELTGEHSGMAIVRRLMQLWPNPILVSDQAGSGEWKLDWFSVMREQDLPVNETVILNMDVIDSVALYRQLRRDTWRLHPRIVNLVWWNTSEFRDPIERHELALSAALFPTFCNSQRTELEIRGLIGRYLPPSMLANATVEHQNLGFPQPDIGTGEKLERPRVVLYPAMWLFARKQPERFIEIVQRVHDRIPLKAVMRLHDKELTSPKLADTADLPWFEVSGLASRGEYWERLREASAFVATAQDESYGLQYLEALWMGVIGIFPRRPWAENILPPGYPFMYENLEQAETMLYYVLANWWDAREQMVTSFPGGMRDWMLRNHSQEDFESELQLFLENQVPELRMVTE